MIGDLQHAVLEIEKLAWNVEGDDLPGAVADQLLAKGEAIEEQRADFGRLPFACQISFAGEVLRLPGKRCDCALVLLGKRNTPSPSFEEGFERRKIAQLQPRGKPECYRPPLPDSLTNVRLVTINVN